MPGTYPPSTAAGTVFYPGYTLFGYNLTPPSSGVVAGFGTSAYCIPYKAVTLVMMQIQVWVTNSVATTISFQPFGNTAAGAGGLYGTAAVLSVPASGAVITSKTTQNLAIAVGGYMGLGITPQSGGSSAAIAMDAILYFTQAAM